MKAGDYEPEMSADPVAKARNRRASLQLPADMSPELSPLGRAAQPGDEVDPDVIATAGEEVEGARGRRGSLAAAAVAKRTSMAGGTPGVPTPAAAERRASLSGAGAGRGSIGSGPIARRGSLVAASGLRIDPVGADERALSTQAQAHANRRNSLVNAQNRAAAMAMNM
jgi:hypothetical protein